MDQKEESDDKLTKILKEHAKLKADYKECKAYSDVLDAEVQVLKKDTREKDLLVKNIKTECANALLGKEQSSKTKMYDIENKVADLEYANQKYIV